MGDQGLAERLAAETARNLTILEGIGERIQARLRDDAALAQAGVKVGALPRDYVRMYREYRMGLDRLRMEALLRQKLRLNLDEEAPMSEEEYQEALAELHADALNSADRGALLRELERRPQVQLPPPGSVVIEAESTERPGRSHAVVSDSAGLTPTTACEGPAPEQEEPRRACAAPAEPLEEDEDEEAADDGGWP